MSQLEDLPRYDISRSYQYNYEHAPDPVQLEVPAVEGPWDFCGLPVDSPLGIAAGPLLNGRWVLYYASLGFDVLTYKTVRSVERLCYPHPNLLPVRCGQLVGGETSVLASQENTGSWAVSFGMPSRGPEIWRADVEATRNSLPSSKVLSVSVVASAQPDWTLDDLAADYARCAVWAVDSGADTVETNFSCPNVSTVDGQLYQQPEAAGRVAQQVRAAIGKVPLLIKIGHLAQRRQAAELVAALSPHADALVMTNSVATQVVAAGGGLLFDGQQRGICGAAIRTASLEQTALVAQIIAQQHSGLRLVGVGGVGCVEDVKQYFDAGAGAIHLATAAMLDPAVALTIRRQWLSPSR